MPRSCLRARFQGRGRVSARRALLAAAILVGAAEARADPVRVYAAGSLIAPLRALIAASGLPPDAVAPPTFGPAGLLRERVEKGEQADLLLSADLAGPERLAGSGRTVVPAVPFARNRLCVAGKQALGLAPDTLLDRMLAPDLRLATSTPGADPGGDYALAAFARAEAVRPGARAALEGKALRLLGGPASMAPAPGHGPVASVFLADRADLLLYYCSGTDTVAASREVPGLVSVPLPPTLEPGPVYGMAVLSANPDALRLALFTLSERGQAILAENGLLPVLAGAPLGR